MTELFDWKRVCHVFDNPKAYKRHPEWKKVLDTCAIFDFRKHDFEKLQQETSISDDAKELMAPLPFPQIAIVHDWQVYVLDLFWLSEEAQIVAGNLLALMCPFPEYKHEYETAISGYVEIDFSTSVKFDDLAATTSDLRYTSLINGKPTYVMGDADPRALRVNEVDPHHESGKKVLPGLFMNVITFLTYINSPERFIVEQLPEKTGKLKKGRIPRLYQRPQYIILDKQSIKKRYLDSQPNGRKSPMPHLRRGHYRTLTSEKFKRKHGQRVWVRATHVKGNTVEWREGERHYRVI